jgi:hypothetical protein
VRAALPTTTLGVSVDGSLDAKGTLTALGPFDANLVALRPAPTAGKGLLTATDVAQLGLTVPVLLDGIRPASIPAVACMTGIAGVLVDRLAEASATTTRTALISAQRGATVCPGLSAEVNATTLEYPDAPAQPLSVNLACDRDCLYLVTLDGPTGRPVVAHRGQLTGGAAPQAIELPQAKLGAGNYTVGVRLIARVNPGAVTTLESPPLAR